MNTYDCIIYDCEIIKCIPQKSGKLDPTLEYCEGWDDHQGMGISVIGYSFLGAVKTECWNSNTQTLSEMKENFIKRTPAGFSPRTVIGFNSRKFDDRLLAANGLTVKTDYDLLEEIRLAAYGSISWEDQPSGFTYSLDAVAKANGQKKTGSGALAPELWQRGEYRAVIDYCKNDVAITRALLLKGLKGELKDPNTDVLLRLRPLP
jgi:hypothetical protein